jgi:hypothetical protein
MSGWDKIQLAIGNRKLKIKMIPLPRHNWLLTLRESRGCGEYIKPISEKET